MRIILGKKYITEKEASDRYGFSTYWFRKRRFRKKEPKFSKIEGKVLYSIDETDQWFKTNMKNY